MKKSKLSMLVIAIILATTMFLAACSGCNNYNGYTTTSSSDTSEIIGNGNDTASNGNDTTTTDDCSTTSIPQFTITFNTHGGSAIESQIVDFNTVAIRPESDPTRTDYNFINWFTAETGGEVFDFANPITANTTIHAQWAIQQFTITFNTHGGNAIASQTVNVNGVATRPSTNPTRADHNFVNWFTSETGGEVFNFSNPITANTTIHAQWSHNYLTFNAVGNTITGLTALGRQQATLTIPAGVTTVGFGAFSNAALTSITIPASVTNIGAFAFSNTTALQSVTFESSSQLTSIENSVFSNSALTSITIPASVTSIGMSAFDLTTSLQTIAFEPSSQLATIASDAFRDSALASITIPTSVTNIGMAAFRGWTANQTINVVGHASTPVGWNPSWLQLSNATVVWNYGG